MQNTGEEGQATWFIVKLTNVDNKMTSTKCPRQVGLLLAGAEFGAQVERSGLWNLGWALKPI
jgi:hypothetical protein